MNNLTEATLAVFLAYANDAPNWAGRPMIGCNVASDKHANGHLTNLKKAGLIETFKDDCGIYIEFTEAGERLAEEHGICIW